MVGRDSERARLRQFLNALHDGPAAVVLRGDAGIGKTTIWRTALSDAADEGVQVLVTRPRVTEVKTSFSGLGDLLDEPLSRFGAALPGVQREALETALLRTPRGAGRPDARAVSVAALGLLREAARTRPTVIAIDDLQWLDRSTARVLGFALRRLEAARVGVLATLRSDVDDPVGVVEALGAERTTVIHVGPLSLGAVDRLIRTRVGASLTRPALLKVSSASKGNPFFALELARALVDRGGRVAPGAPLPIPDELSRLLLQRREGLSGPALDLLDLLCVLESPTLSALRSSRSWRDGALDETVRAGLVEVDGDVVHFNHPLLASAIWTAVGPERRRDLHLAAADIADDGEGTARHLALGATGPAADIAGLLEEASGNAYQRGALEAAAELMEQSLSLTPRTDLDDVIRRSHAASDHFWTVGDTSHAASLLDAVTERLEPGPVRASALLRLGHMALYSLGPAASLAISRQALAEAGDDDLLRADILIEMMDKEVLAGDLEAGRARAREAYALLARTPDQRLSGEALGGLWFTDFLAGVAAPVDMDDRATGWPDRDGRRELLYSIGRIRKAEGNFDAARAAIDGIEVLVREGHQESEIPITFFHRAELEARAGEYAGASAYATAAAQAADLNGQTHMLTPIGNVRALVDACRGDESAARAGATHALHEAERVAAPVRQIQSLSVLGFLDLSLERYTDAAAHLERAVELASRVGIVEPGFFQLDADVIETRLALGQLDTAEGLLESFEDVGARLDRAWAVAAAGRCRGLLTAIRGDPTRALSVLDRALVDHARVPMPLERARTQLVRGQVARRAKRWGESRISLQRALDDFESLGAGLWAARARGELARVGGRPAAPTALSESERQVAQLVASGMTNQEVADTLFLSPRAVGSNLTKAYRKLGVRNRVELAARLAEGAGTG